MVNNHFDFSDVDVVLADSLPASRNSLRSILLDLGFRRVAVCSSVEEMRTIVEGSPVDLLVADTELPEGDTCAFIHETRHGFTSGNPFVPVLTSTWQPTEEVVQKAVSAGVDAFLTLPASLEGVREGLTKVVTMRRPFVVTSDYVGPDRRKNVRSHGLKVPLIEVPNPVRAKVLGGREKINHQDCMNFINEQKVERHASSIAYLVAALTDYSPSGPKPESEEELLHKLRVITKDLVERISSTRHSPYADQCREILPLAERLDLADVKKRKADLERLAQMALTLETGIHAGDSGVLGSMAARGLDTDKIGALPQAGAQ
jgi:CheY-like chemotaxis protein